MPLPGEIIVVDQRNPEKEGEEAVPQDATPADGSCGNSTVSTVDGDERDGEVGDDRIRGIGVAVFDGGGSVGGAKGLEELGGGDVVNGSRLRRSWEKVCASAPAPAPRAASALDSSSLPSGPRDRCSRTSIGSVVVHEGEKTLITYVPDYAPPSGGRTRAAVAKSVKAVVAGGAPGASSFGSNASDDTVLCLNNEFNVLSRYLVDCPAARRALAREDHSLSGDAGPATSPSGPTLYLEWVEGMSLKEWVEEKWAKRTVDNGAIEVKAGDGQALADDANYLLLRDVRVMLAVAGALADVNEAGVVHHDISSANIIVHQSGDGDDEGKKDGDFVAKIIDFGFATRQHALESDDVGETVNDDLYSLGLVFCEVLIDRPIPHSVRDGIDTLMASFFRGSNLPRSLISLLSDVLEFNSSDEVNPYRSVREVVEDLEQMANDPERFLFDPRTPEELAEREIVSFIPDRLYGKFEEFSETLMGAYKRNLSSSSPRSVHDSLLGASVSRHRHRSTTMQMSGMGERHLSTIGLQSCGVGVSLGQEIVLISGPSGSGKSHLAHLIRSPLMREGGGRPGGLFAWGQYEKLRLNQPYSALSSAFNSLCDQILLWDEADRTRVRDRIVEAVGPEWQVLTTLVPNLHSIVGKEEPSGEDPASLGTMEAQSRLKFVVRMFVRAVCQREHPVALVLEDLQWADAASLDIVMALLTDPELQHFLFVGCYRPRQDIEAAEEIASKRASMGAGNDDGGISERSMGTLGTVATGRSSQLAQLSGFAAYVAQMEDLEEDDKLRITRIEIGSLDLDSMNLLISDALRMPRRLTRPLTERLYRKTQGNIYFTKECLELLSEEGILTYDKDIFRWRWNTDGLKSHAIANSMVDLITGKIRKLSLEAQGTLKVAACVGICFDRETLEMSMREPLGDSGSGGAETLHPASGGVDVRQHLDLLETEGFIESEGQSQSRYAFAHNRIHHAAYSLMQRRERNRVHSRIGEIMWKNASEERRKDILFTAVDHMNKGKMHLSDERRTDLALLNIRAGEESISKLAFFPALNYLNTASKLLPENHWEGHYDMSLRLYNALIEVEQCNGRFEEMNSHLAQVFSHATCFSHKLQAYKFLIRAYGAQKHLQEAIDTGLDVLLQLGQRFPRSTPSMMQIGKDYLKTRLALRGKTDRALKKLAEMEDRTILDAMQIISSLIWYAYLAREELVPLLVFRMVRLTLRHGVSKITAFAFAMYGMILCGGMGDYKGGNRFADLAFDFLDRFPAKEWVARVNGGCYYCIRHWRQPLSQSLEPLLRCHRVGQEAGDNEYAFVVAHCYCCHAFHSGQSLVDLEEKAGEFCFNMEQQQQRTTLNTTLPLWQMALNLMGQSSDPFRLSGEAMDEEEIINEAVTSGSHNCVYIIKFCRMVLSYLFGNYELAWEMAEKTHNIGQVIMASFFGSDHAYYSGLIACALLCKGHDKKMKKQVVCALRKMKKLSKSAPGNCLQKYLLLKAELAASKGKRDAASRYYDEAIEAAVKNGYIQDEAIANERASAFFKNCGDLKASSRYRSSSHSCYMKWGAFGKADLLFGSEQMSRFTV